MRSDFLLIVWLTPALAAAQSVYFKDDFACSNVAPFGTPAGIYGWQATYASDAWTTNVNGGVSASRDESNGSFGAPADDYESFLVTGHPSWTDIAIEATITNTDNDAMGLVVRYAGPNAYYACYATKHEAAVCTGTNAVGTRVALIRVDAGQTCANDYMVATETTFAYAPSTPYRFRLSARGGAIRCMLDADADGTLGSAGDLSLAYDDPSPLGSGLAGLYNFDNGEPTGGVIFDDVLITGFDLDTDHDGLPDAVEADVGTDPARADSDRDGISDREEALMPANPPNLDGDGSTDALDPDSDGDGIPDRWEAGDQRIGTPAIDTDCDGIPNFRDADSDNDGIPDATDSCRLVAGTQPDADGDGVGAACDPNDNDASVCGDTDGDTCDDCASGAFAPNDDGADSDGDGLCDAYDSDGDGIPTLVEQQDGTTYGSDPDGDGRVSWLDPDADGDGIPDATEGTTDADGDGIPDYLNPADGGTGTTHDDFIDLNGDGIDDRVGVGGGGLGACASAEGSGALAAVLGLLLLRRRRSR